MIQSMTGYGKASAVYNGKKINVEIRTLNSKSLDLTARISPAYREKDIEMRKMIAQVVERGKVDFAIWTTDAADETASPINGQLLYNYYQQIKKISADYGIPEPEDWYSCLLRMPDVTAKSDDEEEMSDEEWETVKNLINEALQHLVDFRIQEGKALQAKFTEKIENISRLLSSIEPYETGRVEKIKARLMDALKQIPEAEYDHNRLEQELIYYIEKLDISEEKQRLSNHLRYFMETMNEGHSQGKKLGFIAQEMGREINTTGSKSNQAEMQNIVVMMKDELEQIKEQVLNVM